MIGASAKTNNIGILPSTGRLSFVGFLKRYPILLLAFGPPIFRASSGIDATKGVVDFWAFIQVGWISVLAIRAILRIAYAKSFIIPKQIRSALRLAFILGLLFLVSAAYSTNPLVSVAYSILYIFAWICVVEFIANVHMKPPEWLQFIFQLRLIAFILFDLVVLTVVFNPKIVMVVIPDIGIRLSGGTVASIAVICPLMAIVSAYAFLYSLESKARSVFYFLVGITGTVITQSRGSELALLFSLFILLFTWAKTGKRFAQLTLSGVMAAIVLIGLLVGYYGGLRLWSVLNRGQSTIGIESASGRTEVWMFVIKYCMSHPQGMGYIAGFRSIFREYYALGLQFDVSRIGTAHNAFIQVLADAGWLAFIIYVMMIYKILSIGWHYAGRNMLAASTQNTNTLHAIRCALLLLIFCVADGMNSAEFVLPLRSVFYLELIIISVILGCSAELLTRARRPIEQL